MPAGVRRHEVVSSEVARLLEFVSPRCGIIRELVRSVRAVDEPMPPVLWHARLSDFDFKKATVAERMGGGKGLTDDEAMAGAIGEAIERYCAAHVDVSAMVHAPLGALAPLAIQPEECVLYAEAQYARSDFPYPKPVVGQQIKWLRGREFINDTSGRTTENREVFVPASLVYLYGASFSADEVFCGSTSNGLAAGSTLEAAIHGGLCELIERDAFLVTWMNALPAPEIDLVEIGGAADGVRRHYARFGLETRVFQLVTDVPIPAMMAVCVDRSGRGPAAVIGLGCHLDARTAALKALFEICQVRPGEVRRQEEATAAGRHLHAYEEVHSLEDHSGFFGPVERLSEMGFLLESGRRRSIDEVPSIATGSARDDLFTAVRALHEVGSRVVYVDLTTPDVAPSGLRVVRAIATGLQPMHFGHGEERLGGQRLFELPRKLGYTPALRSEHDLNPCPHPLA